MYKSKDAVQDAPAQKKYRDSHWHPAIYAALKLMYRSFKDSLEFIEEFPLGEEPNIIDMLIIKKRADAALNDGMGRNFRMTNIIEVKSPRDSMNIDDLYRLLGYACEYKTQGKRVNERRREDITLTLLHAKKPRGLLRMLAAEPGVSIVNASPGIYVITGFSLFFTQIAVYGEMPDEECNAWLRSMKSRMSVSEIAYLLNSSQEMNIADEEDKRNANAVMFVALRENMRAFAELKKEEYDMIKFDALRLLFQDDIDRAEARGRAEGEARGRAEGEARGEARGRAEGEARGRAKGEARGIISMARKFNLPDADIIKHLIEALKCSVPEAESMLRMA